MKYAVLVVVAVLLSFSALSAQEPTTAEKMRVDSPNRGNNLPRGYPGNPKKLLKTVSVKAVVLSVDTKERWVQIAPAQGKQPFRIAVAKEKQPLEWTQLDQIEVVFFGQPTGMERIGVAKKAAKQRGKKSIRLEELPLGSSVEVEMYPVRAEDSTRVAAREITVLEFGK